MAANEGLSESQEDYLEAIYNIVAEKGAARAKDIGQRLHVKSPSVTGALRALSERGLVNYAPYDLVTLTRKGQRIAREVVRSHQVIRDFLVRRDHRGRAPGVNDLHFTRVDEVHHHDIQIGIEQAGMADETFHAATPYRG